MTKNSRGKTEIGNNISIIKIDESVSENNVRIDDLLKRRIAMNCVPNIETSAYLLLNLFDTPAWKGKCTYTLLYAKISYSF